MSIRSTTRLISLPVDVTALRQIESRVQDTAVRLDVVQRRSVVRAAATDEIATRIDYDAAVQNVLREPTGCFEAVSSEEPVAPAFGEPPQ